MQPDSLHPDNQAHPSPAADVRTALQRLRDEGSMRGAELHSQSNETWRARKAAVVEKIQLVRDRATTLRRGLFDIIGTGKALREKPELRSEVVAQGENVLRGMFDRMEDRTTEAIDRAIEKARAATDRAEERIKTLYGTSIEHKNAFKGRVVDLGVRTRAQAEVAARTALLKSSESLIERYDRKHVQKVVRRERNLNRIKTANDLLDRGRLYVKDALSIARPYLHPLRSAQTYLERPINASMDRRVQLADRAARHAAALQAIQALRGSGSPTQSAGEVTWSTRGADASTAIIDVTPLPIVDVTANSVTEARASRPEPQAVPFAQQTPTENSAGATPEPRPTGTPPPQDMVNRAHAAESVAAQVYPPLPVSPNTKYNAA